MFGLNTEASVWLTFEDSIAGLVVLQSPLASVATDSLEERDASGVHSERFPMLATIDVPLTIRIKDDKTIPLATLAEFITDQNIESVLLEGIVKALCGEKHEHGNGEQRFPTSRHR